jgi:uncharacterized protein (DUF427 family)
MSLTAARGPFGDDPTGRFNFEPDAPTGSVLFWDPVPYRLRAFLAGELVFDTAQAKLLHESGHLPVYYVPAADLREELLEPSEKTTRCPHKGEACYRTLRAGDRVEKDAVWTYGQPLEPSPTRTRCAYKGSASYWHVTAGEEVHEDIAWSYPDPDDDGRDVRGLICFFQERCQLELDGATQEQPVTQWSG